MNVRGWLILGGPDAASGLPSHRALIGGTLESPTMPNAAAYKPGDWLLWRPIDLWKAGGLPEPSSFPLVLLCVDVPVA